MNQNTTGRQDDIIRDASQRNHIDDLISIIENLDEQITEWKNAAEFAGCDTPETLRNFINSIDSN